MPVRECGFRLIGHRAPRSVTISSVNGVYRLRRKFSVQYFPQFHIPVDIQGVECRAGDSIASVVLATTAIGARQSHPASAALHLTEPCLAAHHVGHLASRSW